MLAEDSWEATAVNIPVININYINADTDRMRSA